MPAFPPFVLERLIESGASERDEASGSFTVSKKTCLAKPDNAINSNLARKTKASRLERKHSRPMLTPALYVTPETTPLPDSPSSYTPSPYIINHKRRGPRLLNSSFQTDLTQQKKEVGNEISDSAKINANTQKMENVEVTHTNGFHTSSENGEGATDNVKAKADHISNHVIEEHSDEYKHFMFDMENDGEDFFDPQESMSCTSTDAEDSVVGSTSKVYRSGRAYEFYDAWDELSSESSHHHPTRDYEVELAEVKITVLKEIEKRKQAEEALSAMISNWQKLTEQLAVVGILLPAHVSAASSSLPIQELCRQFTVARYVATAVGRGVAKAEVETELKTQLDRKNFEISRLSDRLRYYDAMNREMSQRNQEAAELARRKRLMRRRRRRVWWSIASAIFFGATTLVWLSLGPCGEEGNILEPNSDLHVNTVD